MERRNCPVCGGDLNRISEAECVCEHCGGSREASGVLPGDGLWEAEELSPKLAAEAFLAYETAGSGDKTAYLERLSALAQDVKEGRRVVAFDEGYAEKTGAKRSEAAAIRLMYESLAASEKASSSEERRAVAAARRQREKLRKNCRVFLTAISLYAVLSIVAIGRVLFDERWADIPSFKTPFVGAELSFRACLLITLAVIVLLIGSLIVDKRKAVSRAYEAARVKYISNIEAVRSSDKALKAIGANMKSASEAAEKAYPEVFAGTDAGACKGA